MQTDASRRELQTDVTKRLRRRLLGAIPKAKGGRDEGLNGDELSERVYTDDDPLVRRLCAMEWAEVPAEVRERCWQQTSKRIDELEKQGILPTTKHDTESSCERYAFSRRAAPCKVSAPRANRIAGSGPAFRARGLAWASR
jgi:hypothetical protein